MNVVIVFESLFGNTRDVAQAVAEGVGSGDAVEVVLMPVADADVSLFEDADLLLVGGPTHVHGMASERSRVGAIGVAGKSGLPEPVTAGPVLRDWFEAIPPGGGRCAAGFDTRIGKPKVLTGSAAGRIVHLLDRAGYDVVGEESFIVEGTAGPLRAGELDRAREWGRHLVRGAEQRSPRPEAHGSAAHPLRSGAR